VDQTHAAAAETFAQKALSLRSMAGRNEAALVQNLVSRLRQMFPPATPWIDHLIRAAETQLTVGGGKRIADTIVGYTSIEWESNLTDPAIYAKGKGQVREHLAGLLNQGAPEGNLIGVLSDTVIWEPYKVAAVRGTPGKLAAADLDITAVGGRLDLAALATDKRAEPLIDFIALWLGREGAHPLDAETIGDDLGFDSSFGRRHVAALAAAVASAMAAAPIYADQVQKLWERFVGSAGGLQGFDNEIYVRELFLGSLAKLICANVIVRHPLHSSEDELREILDGRYFRDRGLENLVEKDYFGWLQSDQALVDVAEDMQRGLRTFDFDSPAAEDIFGRLFAQLIPHDRRVLLGQEWTPPWLGADIARAALASLPHGAEPHFLDPCCGSGGLMIELVKAVRAARGGKITTAELVRACTGFDIDPLAVIVARVNWVVSNRDVLEPFDRHEDVSIPVYLADSMFAQTPVGTQAAKGKPYELELEKHHVELPSFLLTPENAQAFDSFVQRSYDVAAARAEHPSAGKVSPQAITELVENIAAATATSFTSRETSDVEAFVGALTAALEDLERRKLNGIWAFILRNSYRPALVAGEFNGLIMNPPWLAMSKLADNPFKKNLQAKAARYDIAPGGQSKHHLELATTFLLHAADDYLAADGVVACVLPETLLNGDHHKRFRRGDFRKSVALRAERIDRVEEDTFRNNAIVLHCQKTPAPMPTTFSGRLVGQAGAKPLKFERATLGNPATAEGRLVWTDTLGIGDVPTFNDLSFRQGADVMPRRAFFLDAKTNRTMTTVAPIDRTDHPLRYLVNQEKKAKNLRVRGSTPNRFMFDVFLSKHLAPFLLANPADAFLPIVRATTGNRDWQPVQADVLAATNANALVRQIVAHDELPDTLEGLFDLLNTRGKLVQQRIPNNGYLAVYAASGGIPAAAYKPLADLDPSRIVIDQTLYWSILDTEDEALYLTSLFNSDAVRNLIRPFQPKGALQERHIHGLLALVTPGYDKANPTHTATVAAAQQLVADLAQARKDGELPTLENTPNYLDERRRVLAVIRTLASYQAYEQACAAVYADAKARTGTS
jgi:methylase of polypeptide subunit release factors